MRCKKCGYISFDKVETCSKCAASLADISGKISGTVQKVEAPSFLASVLGDTGGQALVEDDQDVFAAQETEFDLSGDEDEEGLEEDVADVDVALDEGAEIDMGDDESEVPSIDLSQFNEEQSEAADEADTDTSIDFQMEEDEKGDGDIDFELEEEEGGLDLDSESELSVAEKAEPEAESEGGISLDLDVELEDEPAEDEMVFNLEDIDMSDLVIEEGANQADASPPTGEDAALDLEDFLADGGDGAADLQLDDIPMDLSLEDGELLEGDRSNGQEK